MAQVTRTTNDLIINSSIFFPPLIYADGGSISGGEKGNREDDEEESVSPPSTSPKSSSTSFFHPRDIKLLTNTPKRLPGLEGYGLVLDGNVPFGSEKLGLRSVRLDKTEG